MTSRMTKTYKSHLMRLHELPQVKQCRFNSQSMAVTSFQALLDSGSTHNFINLDTIVDLNLQRTFAPNSPKVAVVNGDQISNMGIYNNLSVQIDTEPFIIDCYSIKLGGYDFILGVNWLSLLGPII